MKYRVVCLFVTVAAGIFLAAAQDSQLRPSSASGADPLKRATQPLIPKSAMPVHHPSPAVAPNGATSGRNTNEELNHLERQNVKTPSSKSGKTGTAKAASVPKSPDASAGRGSGINFKYQKPVGGTTAANTAANQKGSSIPRVTKKN
jgi:hypothetical protein